MKRFILRSVAFFTTLSIGVAAGFVLAFDRWVTESPIPREPDVVVSDPKADMFTPEFDNLPGSSDCYLAVKKGKVFQLFDDENEPNYMPGVEHGQSWFVLTEKNEQYSLTKARASVELLPGYYDDELAEFVSFAAEGNHVLAVRDIPDLKAGPVVTLFYDDGEDGSYDQIGDNYRREFDLGGETYVLRTLLGLTVEREKAAVLVLEKNGRSQVIKQIPYYDGGRNFIGNLLWAGDLDGDGKLDIFFREFAEKCSTFNELHLSSTAAKGDLVGLAAR